jgi:integrin beta 1
MEKSSIYFLGAFVLISIFSAIESQSSSLALTQNPCVTKANCGSCIQTQKCAWCMQPEFGDRPRCFQPDINAAKGCPEEYVVNPDNEQLIERGWGLSRGGGQSSDGGTMVSGGSVYEEESGHSSMSGSSSASGGSSMSGSSSGSSSGGVVQITPQRVNLKLRISEFSFETSSFSS